MGLQTQLSDFSSESIVIIMAMLVGKGLNYLRSLIHTFLYNLGLLSPATPFHFDADFMSALNDVVGSSLGSLIVLCDQLNINRGRSYPNHPEDQDADSDCVVCLNRLAPGDHVRRLDCRHVFHKDCFDGWLHHLNFNCPLCRAPLVSHDYVQSARRRVAGHFLDLFPSHAT